MAEYEFEQRRKRAQRIVDSRHDFVRENTRVLTPFEQRTAQVDWHSHHRDLVTSAFVKRNISQAQRQKRVIENTREMQHTKQVSGVGPRSQQLSSVSTPTEIASGLAMRQWTRAGYLSLTPPTAHSCPDS